MNDGRQDCSFAELQFKALREEILGIKERVIKLQLVGISGVPLIVGAGQKYDLTFILLASPLIVLVFAFMVLFEQGSLMRAGEYIRNNIEPVLSQSVGWESWLQEENSHRRKAETFFAWSVYIAFAIYYVIGTWLAYGAMNSEANSSLVATIGVSMYCGGFLLAMYLIISNFRVGTGPAYATARTTSKTSKRVPLA